MKAKQGMILSGKNGRVIKVIDDVTLEITKDGKTIVKTFPDGDLLPEYLNLVNAVPMDESEEEIEDVLDDGFGDLKTDIEGNSGEKVIEQLFIKKDDLLFKEFPLKDSNDTIFVFAVSDPKADENGEYDPKTVKVLIGRDKNDTDPIRVSLNEFIDLVGHEALVSVADKHLKTTDPKEALEFVKQNFAEYKKSGAEIEGFIKKEKNFLNSEGICDVCAKVTFLIEDLIGEMNNISKHRIPIDKAANEIKNIAEKYEISVLEKAEVVLKGMIADNDFEDTDSPITSKQAKILADLINMLLKTLI